MNSKYVFSDVQFGADEEGIHMLRNGFAYKTIPFREITSMRIFKGKEYSRWPLILTVGILLGVAVVVYTIRLFFFVTGDSQDPIYFESIALIAIPAILSGYLIFISFKKGMNLQIEYAGKKKTLSIKKIEMTGQIDAFQDWMQKQAPSIRVGNQ